MIEDSFEILTFGSLVKIKDETERLQIVEAWKHYINPSQPKIYTSVGQSPDSLN